MTNEMQREKFVGKSVVLATVLVVALGAASAQTTSPLSTQSVTIAGSPSNIRPGHASEGVPGGFRRGHILVKFKAVPGQAVLDDLSARLGARLVDTIPRLGILHFQVSDSGLALLEHLRGRPDVQFAEFDYPVQVTLTPNDTYYNTALQTSHYGKQSQWGPQAISAPTAWDQTLGVPSVVIAIVDTGVDDTHPDLAAKIVGEKSEIGGGVHDGFGHGTHCAGIAAAVTNNATGIAGMCPNCGILNIKVLNDQGAGYISDVAKGITDAADMGARVISLSLGGAGHTETMHSALDYAIAHSALPVCAMGNNYNHEALEPAYWHDCLSVIATDKNGSKADFSNYGTKADVAAPGVAIVSTLPTYPVTLNNYGFYENYDALSGTSMATPHVAGLAGLVISKNPSLTATQVRGIIEATAGNGSSWTQNLAFGLVNASKAVASAASTVSPAFAAPVTNLVIPNSPVSEMATFQAAPTDNTTTVHHVDIVSNGARLLPPLTASTWTGTWPSTTVFNGSIGASAAAVDIFGNEAAPTNFSFNVQNNVASNSGTAHLCFPPTTTCHNSVFQQVTNVNIPAATHIFGSITYDSLTNAKTSDFWLQVAFVQKVNGGPINNYIFLCGTTQTTVDCYPDPEFILYEPDSSSTSNWAGGQFDPISSGGKQATGTADINWTVQYPQ
jgi:thermitase